MRLLAKTTDWPLALLLLAIQASSMIGGYEGVEGAGTIGRRASQLSDEKQLGAKGQAPPPTTAQELENLNLEEIAFVDPVLQPEKYRNRREGMLATSEESSLNPNLKPRPAPQFVDAYALDGAIIRDLTRLIGCSMGFGESDPECENVHLLADGGFYGIRTKGHVLIAFPPDLSRGVRSAARARLEAFERFKLLARPLNVYLEKLLATQCEFVFTGIGDGGALAVMAAWHAVVVAGQLKAAQAVAGTRRFEDWNADNQIKVVTFDELVPFTRNTALRSPIQERNHLRLGACKDSIVCQVLSLGSLNDANAADEDVHTNIFPVPAYVAFDEAILASLLEKLNTEIGKQTERLKAPGFYRACNVKVENVSSSLDKADGTLACRAFQLINAYQLIFPETYRAMQVKMHLNRPHAVCHKLSQVLQRDFFGEPVTCEAFDYRPGNESFRISCSVAPTMARSRNVLSFHARLGDEGARSKNEFCSVFSEGSVAARSGAYKSFKDCRSSKNRRSKPKHRRSKEESETDDEDELDGQHFSPEISTSSWSRCIYSLSTLAMSHQPKQNGSLSEASKAVRTALFPFLFDDEKQIRPACTFLSLSDDEPLESTDSKGHSNKHRSKPSRSGAYLHACNISEDMRRLHSHHRGLFYRVFRAASGSSTDAFPSACHGHLLPVPLRESEAKTLLALSGPAAQYLNERLWPGPLASSAVELWNPPLPRQFAVSAAASNFETLEMYRSSAVPLSLLSKRSIHNADFEWELKQCIEDESWLVYDCTDPVNMWIPGACPSFCMAAHREAGLVDERFCKSIRKCGAAGFFVSVSSPKKPSWFSFDGPKPSDSSNEPVQSRVGSPLQKLAVQLNTSSRCIFGCFRVKILNVKNWRNAIASVFSSGPTEFDLALIGTQPRDESGENS